MIRFFKKTLLASVLVAVSAPANAEVTISEGTYLWQPSFGGCAWLVVSKRLRYHYDQDCDGDRDYVGQSVRLDGQNISVDAAYLAVKSADADSIKGTWIFQGQYEAEFKRR